MEAGVILRALQHTPISLQAVQWPVIITTRKGMTPLVEVNPVHRLLRRIVLFLNILNILMTPHGYTSNDFRYPHP